MRGVSGSGDWRRRAGEMGRGGFGGGVTCRRDSRVCCNPASPVPDNGERHRLSTRPEFTNGEVKRSCGAQNPDRGANPRTSGEGSFTLTSRGFPFFSTHPTLATRTVLSVHPVNAIALAIIGEADRHCAAAGNQRSWAVTSWPKSAAISRSRQSQLASWMARSSSWRSPPLSLSTA